MSCATFDRYKAAWRGIGAVVDVGKVGQVPPVWPSRPADNVQDSSEQSKRRSPEKESADPKSPTAEDGESQQVDDYA